MRKKKASDAEVTEEEIVREAEAQGDLSHDEADSILAEDAKKQDQDDESDVKRPGLTGHNGEKPKTDFEQPGQNNQKRVVEGEE
jgi:hypothetical protein